MTMRRTLPAVYLLLPVLFFSSHALRAAVPDYKLGDTAVEDVITPVPLLIANPEATEALKQKVATEVPAIVRLVRPVAAEAETELRASIAAVRMRFEAALQRALPGRAPTPADVGSPAYLDAIRETTRGLPRNFPLTRLAPLWVGGAGDEALVGKLVQPVREVMAQPVVAEAPPANVAVRLIAVESSLDSPSMRELEASGEAGIAQRKPVGIWRARRLVEINFPPDQQDLGRFAAGFVRANAFPAPGLTAILRAKRLDGVTVNDSFDAAQVVVKKGQIIDGKALAALAAVREKSLIGTLQTKLDQEHTLSGQISRQSTWMAVGLGAVCLVLLLIFWRLRSRPGAALVPVPAGYQSLPGGEQAALPGDAGDENWKDRAMAAEMKAARAQAAIRTGALGWMKDKVFQSAVDQRAELLSAQQRAEAEMRELEQRLEQLHTPLQERIKAYEKRIEELEMDLAAKGEENRELIGARISVAKQQLSVERGRFGSTEVEPFN